MTHTNEYLEKNHRHLFRRLRKGGLLLFVIVLVALLVVSGIGAGRVLAAVLDARDGFVAADAAVREMKFDEALLALEGAETALLDADAAMGLLLPLRPLPWVGRRIHTLDELVEAGLALTPSLQKAMEIGDDLFSVVGETEEGKLRYEDLSAESRQELLSTLEQSLPELERLRAQLARVMSDVEDIESLPLTAAMRETIDPMIEAIPQIQEALDFLIPLATIAPEFGGLGEEKHFLLLFENNDELRPGGGFIGSLGDLVVKDGEVVSLSTEDVYALDGPVETRMTTVPPEPISRYMNVAAWFLRDANWSPDGPISFEKVLEFLAVEETLLGRTPREFDGVIAMTPTFVSGLLNIIGPITVEDQTFTAENFAEALDYEVQYAYVEKGLHPIQRKEIIGTLTKEVVGKLTNFPLPEWGEIISAVNTAGAEKQLFLYSTDETVQQRVDAVGWSGSRTPSDTDVLMVVDANLAALKSDAAVARTISYRVRQNDQGRLIARVSILYDHQGTFDWKTTRYRTYTRVYAPLGSELLRASGTLLDDKLNNPALTAGPVDVTEELGFSVFGAFTAVEPGAQQTLEFVYYLPENLNAELTEGEYELLVLKQLGARSDYALTVDVDFGTPLVSATPSEAEEEFGDTRYLLNTILDQDVPVYVRQKVGD